MKSLQYMAVALELRYKNKNIKIRNK
ncbi:uncharacterized protein METZ01_LOCUS84502 [marine metagenome]|uniref:Uncharacterized protein n=1 Tax=marine metagenome TaxID=408172 RepID=A0A381UVM7_9ZZZZ